MGRVLLCTKFHTMKIKLHTLILVPVLIGSSTVFSQDSLRIRELKAVDKKVIISTNDLQRMPMLYGTQIMTGKKNEVIVLKNSDADLSTNNTRQVFSKVPGLSVWENDGSGIQVGVAVRGLSPNRSWEFNVRQNGYDITSEAYGYPEAYYNPPMEALEKIEVVRGAASLQYGTQFGGLLNYVTKKTLGDNPFSFESRQTVGSFGMFNTYNAIGGKWKKWNYLAYYHHRNADGWRENSRYGTNAGHIYLAYNFNSKWSLSAEYTHMNYLSQQAGGLTDAQFYENPKQSLRSRNWFSTPWNSSAVNLDYADGKHFKMNLKIFSTISQRNSVGFTKALTTLDTFNTNLGSYNFRQVDRDWYNNTGLEWRTLTKYSLFGSEQAISAGIRAYHGKTLRKQAGIGTASDDYDLYITALQNGKDWGKDLTFETWNGAAFLEHLFQFGKNFSVTPGVRYEFIRTTAEGYISTASNGVLLLTESNRNVILAGIGAEYKLRTTNFYANFTQAFRPLTFSELIPSATTDIVDQNLKDAKGYNADLGYRGEIVKGLQFDVSVFYLLYDNRIGVVAQNGANFKTNIGTSVSKGVEAFVEVQPFEWFNWKKAGNLKVFGNFAYVNAEYTRWENPSLNSNSTTSIEGKKVENVPSTIQRYGLSYQISRFGISVLVSKVGAVFTDAANTVEPNASATIGQLPAYTLVDASAFANITKNFQARIGVNNLFDADYATRRAGGYPGPGLLPGTGRSMYVTCTVKL